MPEQMLLEDVGELVTDGTHIGLGGVLLDRGPVAVAVAIARAGRRDLIVSSFLAGISLELLVAAECVRRVRTGYAGLDRFGAAPVFRNAVSTADIEVEAHSELTFTSGLHAAAAGLPFMPTRGAIGSQVAADLDLRTVDDPYGTGPLLAVPATHLDLAIIHAETVDLRGTVALPTVPSFLWDADATLARAAARVIVSAERIVDHLEGPSLLTGFDVAAFVHAPGGAAPGSMPGLYPTDDAWLDAHTGAADPKAHALELISTGFER